MLALNVGTEGGNLAVDQLPLGAAAVGSGSVCSRGDSSQFSGRVLWGRVQGTDTRGYLWMEWRGSGHWRINHKLPSPSGSESQNAELLFELNRVNRLAGRPSDSGVNPRRGERFFASRGIRSSASLGCTHFDKLTLGAWRRHGETILPEGFDVEVDRLADQLHHFIPRFADSNAAGEVRDMRSPAIPSPLDYYHVTHHKCSSAFQANLLQDGAERARRDVNARFSGHGNSPGLVRMLELSVAPSGPRQSPPVVLQQTNQLPDLQAASSFAYASA